MTGIFQHQATAEILHALNELHDKTITIHTMSGRTHRGVLVQVLEANAILDASGSGDDVLHQVRADQIESIAMPKDEFE